jgi:thymidylate synthase
MVDAIFANMLDDIMKNGEEVNTRNSITKRKLNLTATFNSTPLIGVRRTAWKNALREMEWFLSGSNDINHLHKKVRHWWEPFCRDKDGILHHNYGSAFRKIYSPNKNNKIIEYKEKKIKDLPVNIPKFKKNKVKIKNKTNNKGKYIGYKGINKHGVKFCVIDYVGNSDYLIQFESNNFTTKSKSVNFTKGIVKNPYGLNVLGVGCHGLPKQYSYKKRAYQIWSHMMNRCYNKKRRHYKWYGAKGVVVHPRWKCFEYFLDDLKTIDGFSEWLAGNNLHLDKDYKKANYYGPDSCVFLPQDINVALANAERFYKVPRTELFIDQVDRCINLLKTDPYSRRNIMTTWVPQHVHAGLINPTNCHGSLIMANVSPSTNEIHLTMVQRSADMVLGVPHNFIQYWAFLQYLAYQSGRKVGSFSWFGNDCHIYKDHYDMVDKIVDQYPYVKPTPNLIYKPSSSEFKADDFSLDTNYEPLIKESLKMTV